MSLVLTKWERLLHINRYMGGSILWQQGDLSSVSILYLFQESWQRMMLYNMGVCEPKAHAIS